ncbi:MAG TPA: type III polyketide synthase [Candidatus Obscuribacterales bacterium]
MPVIIEGIATALPGRCLQTDLFIQHAKRFCCTTTRQEKVLEELYRRTEISSRSCVLASYSYGSEGEQIFAPPRAVDDLGPSTAQRMQCYSDEAGMLATTVGRQALQAAAVPADAITHLVTISCTGFYAPGFDIEMINQIPLPPSVQRTHVGFMGCHGAMNGLRVAGAFAQARNAAVLLCTTELCSLHFQYGWSTDKLVANSLFSDGAAALVVRQSAHDGASGFEYLDSASFIVADTSEAMMWRIGDHGFQMNLSTRIPEIICAELPEWIRQWLSKQGLKIADVSLWAVHPGGPRILDAVQAALNLPADALDDSRAVLAQCGNMSSPTVLFILERMLARQFSGYCVMLGFGPGLAVEAALLKA